MIPTTELITALIIVAKVVTAIIALMADWALSALGVRRNKKTVSKACLSYLISANAIHVHSIFSGKYFRLLIYVSYQSWLYIVK